MEEMREHATGDETVAGTLSLAGLEGVTAWARRAVEDVKGPTRGLSPTDLAADIRGLQRVISALTAAQTVRIAHYASRDEERGSDGVWRQVDRGTGYVADFAGDDLAPMLGMAPMTAKRRVHTAAKLTTDLPKTLRAVADGDLDGFRAQIVADETILADRDTCAAVEEIIHPRIVDDTPGAVRRRVRRALTVLDPEAVRLAAKRARMERHVRTREGEFPGMTEWWASLPAEDSAKCWAAIDELAQRTRPTTPLGPSTSAAPTLSST